MKALIFISLFFIILGCDQRANKRGGKILGLGKFQEEIDENQDEEFESPQKPVETPPPTALTISQPEASKVYDSITIPFEGVCDMKNPNLKITGPGLGSGQNIICENYEFKTELTYSSQGQKTIILSEQGSNRTLMVNFTITLPEYVLTIDEPTDGSVVPDKILTLKGACFSEVSINITGDLINKSINCENSLYETQIELTGDEGEKTIRVEQVDASILLEKSAEIKVNYQIPIVEKLTITSPANNTKVTGIFVEIKGDCRKDKGTKISGDIKTEINFNCDTRMYTQTVELSKAQMEGLQNYKIQVSDDTSTEEITLSYEKMAEGNLTIDLPMDQMQVMGIQFDLKGICRSGKEFSIKGDIKEEKGILCVNDAYSIPIELFKNNMQGLQDYQIQVQDEISEVNITVKYEEIIEELKINLPVNNATINSVLVEVSGVCRLNENTVIKGNIKNQVSFNCSNRMFTKQVELFKSEMNGLQNYQIEVEDSQSNTSVTVKYLMESKFEKFYNVYTKDLGNGVSCYTCHGDINYISGTFYFGNTEQELLNAVVKFSGGHNGKKLIIKGKATDSVFMQRIEGYNVNTNLNQNMPQGTQQKSTQADIAIMEDWINSLQEEVIEGDLAITSHSNGLEVKNKVQLIKGTCAKGYPIKLSGDIAPQTITCSNNKDFEVNIVLTNGNGTKNVIFEQEILNKTITLSLDLNEEVITPGNDQATVTLENVVNTQRFMGRMAFYRSFKRIFGNNIHGVLRKHILFSASTLGGSYDWQGGSKINGQREYPIHELPDQHKEAVNIDEMTPHTSLRSALLIKTCQDIYDDHRSDFDKVITDQGINMGESLTDDGVFKIIKLFYPWANYEQGVINTLKNIQNVTGSNQEAWRVILLTNCINPGWSAL